MGILELLRRFQIEPPIDVNTIIRRLGISISYDTPLHPDIVGQIQKIGSGYRISVQPNDHPNRQRFTAAHELGHFLFHSDLLGKGVDDDRMYRSTNIGQFYNSNVHPRHETEANNFAALTLMPEHLIQSRYRGTDGSARELAREFQVSPAAMRIRLDNLGLRHHD